MKSPLPPGWKMVKLGDVAEVQLGKMLDRGKNTGKPFKYLANVNVRWGAFDLVDLKETLFTPEEVVKFSLCPGDLMMCEGGVPGRCAIWRMKNSEIKYQKAIHRIRVHEGVLPEYLQIFFEAIHDKPEFTRKFTGSTIHHLPREVLVNLEIPLPPLAEQKAIVKRLDELLALEREIAADSAAVDDLVVAAKRKVLELAVSGKLSAECGVRSAECRVRSAECRVRSAECRVRSAEWNDGRGERGEHGDKETTDYTDSDAGRARLGELVDLISGTSYGKGDVSLQGVRILRGGNIHPDHTISLESDDVFLPESYRDTEKSPFKTDIVIVASTGSVSVIGRAGLPKSDMSNCQIGAFLRIVRPRDVKQSSYLRLIFLSDLYKKHVEQLAKGTNIKNIKANYILDFEIPLPPLAEQRAIVAKVDELFSVLDAMKG